MTCTEGHDVQQMPDHIAEELRSRLARIEGQVRGLQRMLDDSRDCREIISQMSAAARALERARVKALAAGIRYCATDGDAGSLDQLEDLLVRSS